MDEKLHGIRWLACAGRCNDVIQGRGLRNLDRCRWMSGVAEQMIDLFVEYQRQACDG